jgi:hypothetical protein
MAYTPPSADDFVARFPVFSDKEPAQVQAVLDEALGQVDQTWREADYRPAVMYLTAHLIAIDNSQEDDLINVGNTGPGDVVSESFGGLSVSYQRNSRPATSELTQEYGQTSYGRRYLALLRANFPAIAVI